MHTYMEMHTHQQVCAPIWGAWVLSPAGFSQRGCEPRAQFSWFHSVTNTSPGVGVGWVRRGRVMTSAIPTGRGLATELQHFWNTCMQNEEKSQVWWWWGGTPHLISFAPAQPPPPHGKGAPTPANNPVRCAHAHKHTTHPGGRKLHLCTEFVLSVDSKVKDRGKRGWWQLGKNVLKHFLKGFNISLIWVNFSNGILRFDFTDNAKDGDIKP